MIYFSSDFHGYHKNICRGTSSWDDKENNCRDFNTIEEMNDAIVKSINSVVGENDTLYHLGDWCFGGWENIWNFRKQIVCKHIININGNHDSHIENDKFFPFLEKKEGEFYEISDRNKYRRMGMLKHKNDVTAKDFFTEIYDGTGNKGINIVIEGQKINLNHYPIETWDDIENGAIHLHGHLHHKGDKENLGKRKMDVGWEGKVYSFDEIINFF